MHILPTGQGDFMIHKHPAAYTPVTQDGDLALICKIGQIAADRL